MSQLDTQSPTAAKLLGDWLARKRLAAGLSLSAVAAQARLYRQTVVNAEKGRHFPRPSTLERLFALDCFGPDSDEPDLVQALRNRVLPTIPNGFARLPPEKRQEIASRGGQAAQESGLAYCFTSDSAIDAGTKGGHKVAQDRQHMVEMGRKGGLARRGKSQRRNGRVDREG